MFNEYCLIAIISHCPTTFFTSEKPKIVQLMYCLHDSMPTCLQLTCNKLIAEEIV